MAKYDQIRIRTTTAWDFMRVTRMKYVGRTGVMFDELNSPARKLWLGRAAQILLVFPRTPLDHRI